MSDFNPTQLTDEQLDLAVEEIAKRRENAGIVAYKKLLKKKKKLNLEKQIQKLVEKKKDLVTVEIEIPLTATIAFNFNSDEYEERLRSGCTSGIDVSAELKALDTPTLKGKAKDFFAEQFEYRINDACDEILELVPEVNKTYKKLMKSTRELSDQIRSVLYDTGMHTLMKLPE